MVVAKSETAYSTLKRAFKDRTVDKVYHAVVQGHPDPSRGTIDAPIGRHPKDDWRWAVVAAGKDSVARVTKCLRHFGRRVCSGSIKPAGSPDPSAHECHPASLRG